MSQVLHPDEQPPSPNWSRFTPLGYFSLSVVLKSTTCVSGAEKGLPSNLKQDEEGSYVLL